MNIDLIKKFLATEGVIENIIAVDTFTASTLNALALEWQEKNEPQEFIKTQQDNLQKEIDALQKKKTDLSKLTKSLDEPTA